MLLLKRLNKHKLKFKSRLGITLDFQKSISVKSKLLTDFINGNDTILKKELNTDYEKYRNLLSALTKKSAQAYYDQYFEAIWNIVKNTWKIVKSLISLRTVTSSEPMLLIYSIPMMLLTP